MRINPVTYNYFNIQNFKKNSAQKNFKSNPIMQADTVSFSGLGNNAAKVLKKENILKNGKIAGFIEYIENEFGRLIQRKVEHDLGTETRYFYNPYAKNNELIHTLNFDKEKRLLWETKYNYEKGILKNTENYDADGIFKHATHYEYDNNNRLISTFDKNSDDKIINSVDYYPIEGSPVKSITKYLEKDDTSYKQRKIENFNEQGNLTEIVEHDNFNVTKYYPNGIKKEESTESIYNGYHTQKKYHDNGVLSEDYTNSITNFYNRSGKLTYQKKANSFFGGYGYITTSTEEFLYSPESGKVFKHIFRPDQQYTKCHSAIELKLGDNNKINEIAFAYNDTISKFTTDKGFEAPLLRIILDEKSGKIKEAFKINPDYNYFTGEKPTFVKVSDAEIISKNSLYDKLAEINQVKSNLSEYHFRDYLEEIIKTYEK